MSATYTGVGWNRAKRVYDLVLALGVLLYLAAFVATGLLLLPQSTPETLAIRALGTCALVMLHVILAIGPLARLDRRFLPLLYNRRHLGVAMFLLAAAHAVFSTVQFHGFGDVNPLVSLLTSNTRIDSLSQFPFEWLGLAALLILFLMAATSHDFWLANLSPRLWKSLHMLVYAAYLLLVLHVALGSLQSNHGPIPATLLAVGAATLLALHLAAAAREARLDAPAQSPPGEDWIDVGAVGDIAPGRARMACIGAPAERVAIYRHGEHAEKISCVSNLCAHQNGPLSEGRIVDGCIVCPWHGYQYLPDSGRSPPPFTEKVPTYHVRIDRGRILVNPRPNPPGAHVPPAIIDALPPTTGGA